MIEGWSWLGTQRNMARVFDKPRSHVRKGPGGEGGVVRVPQKMKELPATRTTSRTKIIVGAAKQPKGQLERSGELIGGKRFPKGKKNGTDGPILMLLSNSLYVISARFYGVAGGEQIKTINRLHPQCCPRDSRVSRPREFRLGKKSPLMESGASLKV